VATATASAAREKRHIRNKKDRHEKLTQNNYTLQELVGRDFDACKHFLLRYFITRNGTTISLPGA
jgi:hypothetical protein